MLKILLIEDDLIDQLALTRLIKKNNILCDLHVSDSIIQSRKLIEKHLFDLVICDLNLPDGQAFDLNYLIKKQPFILLSGHIDENINKKAMEYGAIHVLQKGSDLIQLSSVLDFIHQLQNKEASANLIKMTNSSLNSFFNTHRLQVLFNNDQEEIAAILELFINQNPKMIQDAIVSLHEEDFKNLKTIVHRIKSNFLMLGLKDHHQMALEIEGQIDKSSQESVLEKLVSLQSDMQKQYLLIEAALNKLRVN